MGIIALNIIATIAHHITDVDKLREQAEEEAFAKVEDATLKQISKNADSLAANLAPIMAADWQRQTEARYMSYVGTGKRPVIDVTAQDVTPSQNGGVLMPFVQAQPKAKPFDFSALWAGLFKANAKHDGRTYQQVTMPIVNEVKPTEAQPEAAKGDSVFTGGVPGGG